MTRSQRLMLKILEDKFIEQYGDAEHGVSCDIYTLWEKEFQLLLSCLKKTCNEFEDDQVQTEQATHSSAQAATIYKKIQEGVFDVSNEGFLHEFVCIVAKV
ncbi:hypothetical protein Taro_014719 [Colocasia esculenta]|uniref:Uncharacterized protein n=1 Tax=Colocasia esculenta TaxID=4460 RepID=A0A843UK70_COLES|nr:hypothetical protein [Colocasia esculenta]